MFFEKKEFLTPQRYKLQKNLLKMPKGEEEVCLKEY